MFFHTYECFYPFTSVKTLDLDGMKYTLRSVYASNFAKQVSNIQEGTGILWEFELNKALAKEANLCLFLIITAISTSCEKPLH